MPPSMGQWLGDAMVQDGNTFIENIDFKNPRTSPAMSQNDYAVSFYLDRVVSRGVLYIECR